MKRITEIEKQIHAMLTENTGAHFLDSGGAYGRNWQRNQKKTISDFRKAPECTLELSKYNDKIEASVTIDLFHYLTKVLDVDAICNKFNKAKVSNWDSEDFYGVSSEGEVFIKKHFDLDGDSFNSYNWTATFSQVVQGQMLEHKETGEKYVLLQIHGGCDIRGGYTNAKLFTVSDDLPFLDERCYFELVDWDGTDFCTHEGSSLTNELEILAKKHKLKKGKRISIQGSIV